MPLPLVSVVIVNWNDEKWLKDCLHSLDHEGYPAREIIVVDNASTDDSVAMMKREFPQMKLIENKENLGFAKGNNVGILASKGKYVVLLNADTTVDPGWLEAQVKICEADPTIGMCGGKMMLMREPGKLNSAGMYLTRDGLVRHIGDGEKDEGQFESGGEVFAVPGACAFCRRAMLDQIGLLDEDYFAYNEDLDLCWRAWIYGWRCVYVPTARLHHYRNVTVNENQSLYWHLRYLNQRNRLWSFLKNFSCGSLLRYAPWLFWYDVVMMGKGFKALLTRSRPPVELKSRWDALRSLPKTLRKRRVIQRSRRTAESKIRDLAFAPTRGGR